MSGVTSTSFALNGTRRKDCQKPFLRPVIPVRKTITSVKFFFRFMNGVNGDCIHSCLQLRAITLSLQTAWTGFDPNLYCGGSSSAGPALVEIATARSFILNRAL